MTCGCTTKIVQVGGGTDGVLTSGVYDALAETLTLTTSLGANIVITGFTAEANIFAADGALTGARTVDMAGFDLTFNNGGDFIIDGKLTVTGLIDPTGVQFTDNVNQSDASMPNTTIYVTDGTLSGYPAGQLVFKNGGGVYQKLESSVSTVDSVVAGDVGTAAPTDAVLGSDPLTGDQFYVDNAGLWQSIPGGGSLLTGDLTADANHTQDFDGKSQTWNDMAGLTLNEVDGNFAVNASSAFLPSTGALSVGAFGLTASYDPAIPNAVVGGIAMANTFTRLTGDTGAPGGAVSFGIEGSAEAAYLTDAQLFLKTHEVNAGNATVGDVLTLSSLTGEVEFQSGGGAASYQIIDADGDTFLRTETTAGSDEDSLIGNVAGALRFSLNTGFSFILGATSTGASLGGNLFLNGGGSVDGLGGSLLLKGGNATGTGNAGGADLVAGDANSGDGGDVLLQTGTSATGTHGKIHVLTAKHNAATTVAGDVFTLINTATGEGEWVTGTAASAYTNNFLVGHWGAPIADVFTLTYTAAIHGVAAPRLVQVWELDGADYVLTTVTSVTIKANNDVVLTVTDNPDNSFAGRIVIT